MKKNVAILINNAPEVKKFIPDIYFTLREEGHNLIVITDSPFIKSQMENIDIKVSYCFSHYFLENKNSSLHEDLTNHTGNFWESYFCDYERNVLFNNYKLGKEYSKQLLICLHNFFYEIFTNEQIDCFVYENISNSFSYAAYNVSNILSIRYIGLTYSRLPGRIDIHHSLFNNSDLFYSNLNDYLSDKHHQDSKFEEYASSYLNNFENIRPSYMSSNGLDAGLNPIKRYARKSKIQYLERMIAYVLKRNYDEKYDYLLLNPLRASYLSIYNSFKRNLKLNRLNKLYDTVNPETDLYFLYPLHFHPESSTSVWARHYVNELNTITNIAFSLPWGYRLYVKDHPSAAGFPAISFYKSLKRLPNVYLIHHNENTKFLIKKSDGVVTLSSTVGFEALILNKPVVLFGRVFYETHPLCQKIANYEAVGDTLKKIAESSSTIPSKATLYAYYKMTAEGTDITALGNLIKQRLQAMASSELL